MRKRLQISLILILTITRASAALGAGPSEDQTKPAKSVAQAASALVNATAQYKASVEALIPIYENALKTATETLEKRKQLYTQGIISKRDLETIEQQVKTAQAQLDQTRKQITESDQLIAEAKAEQELSRRKPSSPAYSNSGSYSATSAVMRYSGTGRWALAQAAQVQSYFTSKFGRSLPISAYGQSATHDRMRFDHRNSMDVAVHPDSAEGKALISYLRGAGIPYIAFRSAVPGAATGAHIHIGYPSHKMS